MAMMLVSHRDPNAGPPELTPCGSSRGDIKAGSEKVHGLGPKDKERENFGAGEFCM